MARKKMTEEERVTKRAIRENAFDTLSKGLKYLTFDELEEIIALAQGFKKDKLGKEELRLIKEKERIEQQLQKLKTIDTAENL